MEEPKPLTSGGRMLMYAKVAESLRRDIEAQFYPAGTYLPSEGELCARFKVSRTTLRRALRSLARLRLIQPEQGIGHRVEGKVISAGRGGRSTDSLVALAAPRIHASPWLAEMMAGLERALSEAGLRLIVCNAGAESEAALAQTEGTAYLQRLMSMRPRAVVLVDGVDELQLRRLVYGDAPVVVIGGNTYNLPLDSVGMDERLGAYMVCERLLDWADGLVGAVVGAVVSPSVEARLEGYRLALASHGADPDDAWIGQICAADAASRAEEAAEQLSAFAKGRPFGVFCPCAEDVSAVATGLRGSGLSIGSDVALGTVEPMLPRHRDAVVPLVAAVCSAAEMGASAAALIIAGGEVSKPHAPIRMLVAPRLSVAAVYERGVLAAL